MELRMLFKNKKTLITYSDVVITIPIYKKKLTANEKLSLTQCLSILSNYKITFITYRELDTSEYKNILSTTTVNYDFVFFNKTFFENINGYNALMKDIEFYKTFSKYKYILIYQLDAYVFKDELLLWCNKGYDYIGAPWFTEHKPYPNGNPETCGNGGLSLRRINYFIDILSYKGPVETPIYLFANLLKSKQYNIKNFFRTVKMCFGYENNINYYLTHGFTQEDGFFSLTFHKHTFKPILKPDWKTAAKFSFEMSPEFLYTEINGLPFGCHAWEKYDYQTFWQKYIK